MRGISRGLWTGKGGIVSGPLNLDSIDSYCAFFRRQLADAKTVQSEFFRRVLLLSMVESLAKSRYSPRLTGGSTLAKGESFSRLVVEYGEWPEATLYSVPQLCYLLADQGLQTGPLHTRVEQELQSWSTGQPVVLAADLRIEDVAPLVAPPVQQNIVDSARHDQLLWRYRNNLVHEFREPGYPWSFDHVHSPHYSSMSHATPGVGITATTWELSYPIDWLEGLVETIVESLRSYWKSNDLDPREAYDFGSVWKRS